MKHEVLPLPITMDQEGQITMDTPSLIDLLVEMNVLLQDVNQWGRLPRHLSNRAHDLVRQTNVVIDDHWLH